MNCPQCDIPLHISERQGIEIDFCPQCRGIWLDRGELDKIIERTHQALGHGPRGALDDTDEYPAVTRRFREKRKRGKSYDDDYEYDHPRHRKKRRSFLDDMLDIFD